MSKTISIRLVNPQTAWYPGGTILGEVLFTCTEQVDIESISIRFKGKAKTEFTRNNGKTRSTYRSKVNLFAFAQTLFQGPFTLKPGSMSWPFEFVIPLDCRSAKGDDLREEPMFDLSPEQPLPPTFSSIDARQQCSVGYALKAVMNSSRTFSLSRKAETPMLIVQPRAYEPEQFERRKSPNSFSIQTLHLDPNVGNRDLTFKETMRTAFGSDKLPSVGFKVHVELPEGVAAHGTIDPKMYLQYGSGTIPTTDYPLVFLKSFSLSIKSDVFIRTSGLFGEQTRDWSESTKVCAWAGKVPLLEQFDVSQLFSRGLVVPPNVAPTFRTFNMAIRYRWKAKFTIECATKTRDGECALACVVLGSPRQDPNILSVPVPVPVEEEQQLPAYSRKGYEIRAGGR